MSLSKNRRSRVTVRLPAFLHRRLAACAAAAGVDLNTWMNRCLEAEAMKDDPRFPPTPGAAKVVEEVQAAYAAAEPKPILNTPKILVLSTAHITKLTHDRFGNVSSPTFYPKGIDGWIIPITKYWPADVPIDLLAIRDFAEANGCTWIMLDQDADTIADLPVYDW